MRWAPPACRWRPCSRLESSATCSGPCRRRRDRSSRSSLASAGSAHLEHACPEAGADPESFKHQKASGVTDGVPWVVEAAFAYRPGAETYRLIYGCNWSPCIGDLFDLDGLLADHWVYDEAPVIVIVHLACPVLAFTDWGKSTLALPYQIEEAVEAVVIKVVAAWTKAVQSRKKRDSAAHAKRQGDDCARRRHSTYQ